MIGYKTMSYLIGYNDAVNTKTKYAKLNGAPLDYKSISECPSAEYCKGWNDAVKEIKKEEVRGMDLEWKSNARYNEEVKCGSIFNLKDNKLGISFISM